MYPLQFTFQAVQVFKRHQIASSIFPKVPAIIGVPDKVVIIYHLPNSITLVVWIQCGSKPVPIPTVTCKV